MNLDHINIKQLMILQLFFRLRRSQFVRDELPVKQAARYANNFIRNFYYKKSRRRRSCVISNINNLIAEKIEIPNYKPINLKKTTTVNYQTAHFLCGEARRIIKWAIPLCLFW